ncbi:MAG: glycosyltransferase, partial [Chloroflexi bacterium]|nr:glycosyltransferase [Chloroflexota bacterium]
SNAVFSCGSNVVYNVDALRSVGGFEEKFVTEDFATGLKLHMHGWKSLYYNYVYAYGLGPESLPAYFTQQMRWALGTIGIFKKMLAYILRKPRALRLEQWWEYSLSGSYYGIGWVNFILMLCPIAFLLFDIRPLIAEPRFYIAAFLPYFIFAMSTFYFSMRQRGYKVRSLLVGQSLGFSTFWVLMNAAIMVLFNIKRPFGVTPKGVAGKLKLKYLLPQILLIAVSAAAIVVGIDKFLAGHGWAILISVLWAFYHICMLSMVFYFNRTFKPHEWKPVYVQTPGIQT